MLFVTYTEGATSVFDTQLVQYYLLADVTQAYDYCPVSSAPSLVTRLSSCVTDLAHSFASLRLQLNPSKTEFMVWHTSQSSQATQRVPFIDCLFVSHSVRWYISFVTSVFSAGQRTIHAETHHQQGRQRCFYHLRRLRQIRNCVSQDVMAQHFISRLVYCKSVFSSLHAFSLAPLERVQNAAARLVLHLDRQSPVTSALQQLHRLPVKFRIIFKNATLM